MTNVLEINYQRAINSNCWTCFNSACTAFLANSATAATLVENMWSNSSMWSFPAAPTGGTVLNVCDASGCYRCGASCSWTVPAGVTRAKFELWGAGSGSGSACCCGLAPFGGTGAYATICMNVVAGCVYVLCAGCAHCCYTSRSTAYAGCSSYVTGYGLCNFCADGGLGDFTCYYLKTLAPNCLQYLHGATSNRIGIPNGSYYPWGAGFCNTGTDSCFISCGSCGLIPVTPSFDRTFYGCATVSAPNGQTATVSGMPSLASEICFDASACGWIKHPPIPGFANTSQCCIQFCATCTCQGGYTKSLVCTAGACMNIPGAGGFMTYQAAGSNAMCGDTGKFGMVRVTYC